MHLLQKVVRLRALRRHAQVRVDRLRELAPLLERARRREHRLRRLAAAAAAAAVARPLAAEVRLVLGLQLAHPVRQELARDPRRVVPPLRLLVRFDRQLGLFGADVQRLRLRELAALDADLRLRGEHLGDRRRVVRLGDPRGVRPVVLMGVPE